MGEHYSKYLLPHIWREDEPDAHAPIKYDPQFGFDDKQRKPKGEFEKPIFIRFLANLSLLTNYNNDSNPNSCMKSHGLLNKRWTRLALSQELETLAPICVSSIEAVSDTMFQCGIDAKDSIMSLPIATMKKNYTI